MGPESNATMLKSQWVSWQGFVEAKKWWLMVVIVLALDLLTKFWAQSAFSYNEIWTVTSFFYFTLRFNEGAAFSFLADAGGWQRWFFTIITVFVSVVLVVWIARISQYKDRWMEALALALILGGAFGNLYDRVTMGHVVDFIVLHYGEYAWPAFNIADAAICAGAGFMILDSFKTKKTSDDRPESQNERKSHE